MLKQFVLTPTDYLVQLKAEKVELLKLESGAMAKTLASKDIAIEGDIRGIQSNQDLDSVRIVLANGDEVIVWSVHLPSKEVSTNVFTKDESFKISEAGVQGYSTVAPVGATTIMATLCWPTEFLAENGHQC